MPLNTGVDSVPNASRLFFNTVIAPPMVTLMLPTRSPTLSAALPSALTRTSPVILPSCANSLTCPVLTPNSLARIGSISPAVASITLLSSSPRNTPEPNACANCVIAPAAVPASAPANLNRFVNVVVTVPTCAALRLYSSALLATF